MRTSMRPSSGGSSLISKRLLPLLADAAISIASPLSGTAAWVAAVTVSCVVGVAVVAADESCCGTAVAACVPAFDGLIGVCAASAAAECALAAALVVGFGA